MEVSKCWNITEFPKISIKMKNWKTFYQFQTVIHFKEIIQPLPNPPSSDKILLRFWNRSFLKEICRNEQTFAFKELQGCGSWVSRNDAVQIFFLAPNGNMFAGKVRTELTVLREHIVFNVNWVKVRKMGEVFWAKLYCKMSGLIFFASFCWLWDLLQENLKLKKTLMISTGMCGRI